MSHYSPDIPHQAFQLSVAMIGTRMKPVADVLPTLMIVVLHDFDDLAQLVPEPDMTRFSLN